MQRTTIPRDSASSANEHSRVDRRAIPSSREPFSSQHVGGIDQRRMQDMADSSQRLHRVGEITHGIDSSARMATQRSKADIAQRNGAARDVREFSAAIAADPGEANSVKLQCNDMALPVQRVVKPYKRGRKLPCNSTSFKDLTKRQKSYIQDLHAEDYEYTEYDAIEEAKEHCMDADDDSDASDDDAIDMSDDEDAPNPYAWEVTKNAAFTSADDSIQSVVSNFGHPTQAVTAVYQTLGNRIAYAVKGKPNAPLDQSLIDDIYLMLDAQLPLHFGHNSFLAAAWQKNLSGYSGSKDGKALYALMRTKLTHDLRQVKDSGVDFSAILSAISGRPPEVHHFLFKAIYGEQATLDINLGLTERSSRESEFGPGQHELMHYVASGAHQEKFKVLTLQFVAIYNAWVEDRLARQLLAPIGTSK